MRVPARSLGEPSPDQFGLVSGRVIHDDMDVEIGRYGFLDLVQEFLEFGRPVTRPCTFRLPCRPARRVLRIMMWFRVVYNHGSAARPALAEAEEAAACDRAPGSGFSHRRIAPAHVPAG